jgi:8-oxo-dGTP diphosphatase
MLMSRRRQPIRSAGAVVLLEDDADPRVLLVHRWRQGDWTLPKGRVRSVERPKATARREVWEETRVRCGGGPPLLDVAWRDRRRRRRRIRYWLLAPAEDTAFEPTSEVRAIAWVPAREALSLLGSLRDRRAVKRGLDRAAVAV